MREQVSCECYSQMRTCSKCGRWFDALIACAWHEHEHDDPNPAECEDCRDMLTLAEVSRIVEITPGAAARRCRAGKFPGAHLVTGSGRGFWRVPRASVVGVRRDNRGRKARRNEGTA